MEPIQRFQNAVKENNLWIYILSLGKEREVQDKEVSKLIFEKFGFLPNNILVNRVLFRLKNDGYLNREKLKGEKAYKTTEKGLRQLEQMKNICQDLLQKI
ncbi:MAG TPA: hypothetical protein PL093_00095 [Candidatus Pacearchaeota archaeon]|jgi:DNA-binding PadR family transcriptional regulator|nr:hypothetical protein [Candidatus Pacearchaeota archaeon]HRR94594.1 hypothetical protein [Candidatus Paceibacterota bacterium]HPC30460.1 hypothetical protein [Candidatus Pacearchaeota archaeon]HQG09291.1 hypothetical protein [Candidatus Pacearchaeota archaeon]HQH19964.1 hypothetical protein [Candidatus Pacearchaeota archaeon]